MVSRSFAQILLLVCLLPVQTLAFYFYTNTGERKCFLKELSKGTLLEGRYVVQAYDEELKSYRDADAKDFGIVVDVEEVFDDNHVVVHQKGSPSGDFTFIALDSGEHRICVQPNTNGWMSKAKTKVDLEFEIGSDSKFDSKQKGTMASLHEKVNILNARVSEIRREQQLVREREAHFRDASESVNSRAMWWSIMQIIVLIGICAWQMRYLRTFFVKQKVL